MNTSISLKRKDAQKLGYDNAKAWRDMLRSKAGTIAKSMRIPSSDLRWYAAFHNEGTHPHIHLITYSAGKEPHITRKGLEKFKSEFAQEIFKQDLYNIYEEQNRYRNDLRKMGKDKIKEIAEQINQGTYTNNNIEILFEKSISEQTEERIENCLKKLMRRNRHKDKRLALIKNTAFGVYLCGCDMVYSICQSTGR